MHAWEAVMSGGRELALRGGSLFLPGQRVAEADVFIADGRIAAIGAPPTDWNPSAARIDASGQFVAPGFIDIHHHGAAGHGVGEADEAALAGIARFRATTGCTSLLASFVDWPENVERVVRCWEAVNESAEQLARFAGVHFEGPFLSKNMPGAIDPDRILDPDPVLLDELLDAAGGWARVMTVAPDAEHSLVLFARLRDRGVVAAIGHSNASYERALEAVDAGATHTTHSFNAMSGLHHRAPGVAGAMLTDGRLTGEVIADGVHVHPAAIRILLRAKGFHEVAAITDGIALTGMSEGDYARPNGRRVRVDAESVRLENGTLAGSRSTLDRNVRNLVKLAGLRPEEAASMASEVPARIAGLIKDRGTLEQGKLADIVVLSSELNVQLTLVGGREAFRRPDFGG